MEITTIAIPTGTLAMFMLVQTIWMVKEISKKVSEEEIKKLKEEYEKKFRTSEFCDERSGNIENKLNSIEQKVDSLQSVKPVIERILEKVGG